jgi:hypothetical protein
MGSTPVLLPLDVDEDVEELKTLMGLTPVGSWLVSLLRNSS